MLIELLHERLKLLCLLVHASSLRMHMFLQMPISLQWISLQLRASAAMRMSLAEIASHIGVVLQPVGERNQTVFNTVYHNAAVW